MKHLVFALSLLIVFFFPLSAGAQCTAGKIEVSIKVNTDGYAYELYWQLLPAGTGCGSGAVFAGGNTAVGCNGGGAQHQIPGGYGNFQTITEGPWCLDEGMEYGILFIDDFGDGGTGFDVLIAGYPVYHFQGTTTDQRFAFIAVNPPALSMQLKEITTPPYISFGDISIKGVVKNTGTDTIHSFDASYAIDNGATNTETLSGLNIAPFTEYHFNLSALWSPATEGTYDLHLQLSNLNGQGDDADTSDNAMTKAITVKPPVPNIMEWYTEPDNHMTFETIATSTDDVRTPRDLDFQPTGELWIVNKETEQSGGTTVTFHNPGKYNQTADFLQDGNAWHFMSLPTAIAFSNNGNFATTPGVFDANHDGNNPYTGPTLWTSDLAIYAQPSGGNGSHIDMLHESPEAMGIASAGDNKFWLFDSYNNDIVFYDFQTDHGPGNEDHSDGIIRRYKGMSVERINEHIVCHLAYDLSTGWLYIVDGASKRILRLDTNSGTPGGAPTFGPFETLAEYTEVTGATWETVVDTGLIQPAGIDVFGNRMIVSDYSNGDIIIYDITSIPATQLARIPTGSTGVMGLVVGPDGRIWYVNADNNTVMKIEPDSVIIEQPSAIHDVAKNLSVTVYPIPANDEFNFICNECGASKFQLTIFNALGEEVFRNSISTKTFAVDVSQWSPGIYSAMIKGSSGSYSRKVVVQ